jgi:hypothetical protein
MPAEGAVVHIMHTWQELPHNSSLNLYPPAALRRASETLYNNIAMFFTFLARIGTLKGCRLFRITAGKLENAYFQ